MFDRSRLKQEIVRSPLIEVCKTQMESLLLWWHGVRRTTPFSTSPWSSALSYLKLHGHPGDVGLIGVFLAAAAE